MAETASSENPRPRGDDDDGGEEVENRGIGEFRSFVAASLGAAQFEAETLAEESDRSAGLQVDSGVGEGFKEQVGVSDPEVLATVAAQEAPECQMKNQLQVAVCPSESSELSPTSVTQPVSSAPRPMRVEQKSLPQKLTISMPEAEKLNSSVVNPASSVAIVKTPTSDGFNWRKYGQKLVKSPKGSRSYYRCTYSGCFAKRVECCDHSGLVTEMVYKGQHDHDPPRKVSVSRETRLLSPTNPVVGNSIVEQPTRMLNGSDPSTSSLEPIQGTPSTSERKRPNSCNTDGNDEITVKEERVYEPEPKRRLKKDNLACSGALLKPGKKPKFVVHAAGDVGISGDGYRWRKYGQKMVKGNLNPRNYYRCTSAGCPVRKHIETAVDNTSAVIITYKGVHDHDMPVPKKRHGPPSAPLVAATAPASMNSLQSKKPGTHNQITSTQWSVDKEGELTGEALDLGGEKAMESARTLLSIGFEIKPC